MAGTLVGYNELGCWPERQARRSNAAERAADDVVIVDRALCFALRDEQHRFLSLSIVLARKGGEKPADVERLAERTGLDVRAVEATVKRCMRGIRVDLAARGAIPLPGRRNPTLLEATMRRREEIGRG